MKQIFSYICQYIQFSRLRVVLLASFCMLMLSSCQEDMATKSIVFGAGNQKSSLVIGAQPAPTPKAAPQATAAPLRSSAASSSANISGQARTGQLSASVEPCTRLIPSPPRGLACLHCMHPKAKAQSALIVDLLRRSCLQTIAINYLVDGYFGYDEQRLKDHISKLTSGGRKLIIEFYLFNGPVQRRWQSTTANSFGIRISPKEFRRRINTDYELQSQYQQLVTRLVPVIRYARSRGANVLLVPSLEDNLDDDSFKQLYQLTKDAVPPSLGVSYGRSPCPSCYSGNEAGVPQGVFLEAHTASPYFSVSHGIVSNDGEGYYPPGINTKSPWNSVTLSELLPVQDKAADKMNIFILWSADRQGLGGNVALHVLPHPDARHYAVPGNEEQKEIISFLRDGLVGF